MKLQNDLFIKCLNSAKERSLFIFPHAGASPASYVATLKKIDIDVNVYVLSLPGRLFQTKDDAITDFNVAMSLINEFIEAHRCEETYLLGHSMGSLFTYEVVKSFCLQQINSLRAFAISALKVPDHRFKSQKISFFEDSDFKKHIEKYHFIPDEIKNNPVYYSEAITTLKNDFKIIDSYQQPLQFVNTAAKAYIFGFEQDVIASSEDLIKWTEYFKNVEGPMLFPGGHFQIQDSLAAMIKILLEP